MPPGVTSDLPAEGVRDLQTVLAHVAHLDILLEGLYRDI